MKELILVIVGAALVNNIILSQFQVLAGSLFIVKSSPCPIGDLLS